MIAAAIVLLTLQNDSIVQETDGRVVVEIERCATSGDWKIETALEGYSGASYYTWRGPDLFGSPGRGGLSYVFTVGKPGVYHLRIRNRHDDADSTLHNDCFTRMDGGAWMKTYSSVRGQWTWNTNHEDGETKAPARYSLSAGVHTLEVSGRSTRFSIDRIQLYRDGAAESPSPPASPTVLEAMAGPGPYGRHAAKLRSGRDLGRLLSSLREKPDGEEGERILKSLSRYASARLEGALALEGADSAAAVRALDVLAREFEGDETGAKAAEAAERLRREPKVQTELKAEARWKAIEEIRARQKPRRPGGPALEALRAACEQLLRAYPDTVAAAKARDLLNELRQGK
jgi:hypothetical protein